MTRNRVYDINKYMHLNDNTKAVQNRDDTQHDRFARFCQCYACLQAEPELKMSIDEQMIPYKGKNSLRQNVPKKPKKWGFKVMVCCEVGGFTYDFHFHDGKGPTRSFWELRLSIR